MPATLLGDGTTKIDTIPALGKFKSQGRQAKKQMAAMW